VRWAGDGTYKEDGVLRDWHVGLGRSDLEGSYVVRRTHLVGMLLVVQAQASDGLDILRGQGSEEEADVRDLVCNFMLPKDGALDNSGLLGLGNIRHALWKNCISIVGLAISGQESHESLYNGRQRWGVMRGFWRTHGKGSHIDSSSRKVMAVKSLNHVFIKNLTRDEVIQVRPE
jgi:hypothetical protein